MSQALLDKTANGYLYEVRALASRKKILDKHLMKTLSDPMFSVESRWALFTEVESELPTSQYIGELQRVLDAQDREEIDLSGFCYSRRVTHPTSYIVSRIHSQLGNLNNCPVIREIKEQLLRLGYGSYTYDW